MRIIALLLVMAICLLGCSETENDFMLESAAPQVPNQFKEVHHALLTSKIDDVMEGVKTGNTRVLEFLKPGDCKRYDSWDGDWIGNKELIPGRRQGYRFR